MVILQRLSPGPTVPDLMRAEWTAWTEMHRRNTCAGIWHRSLRAAQCAASLHGAALLVVAARVLLRLDLITPDCAVGVLPLATRLTRAAVLGSRE